jgi:hypothetical protein
LNNSKIHVKKNSRNEKKKLDASKLDKEDFFERHAVSLLYFTVVFWGENFKQISNIELPKNR